MRAWHIISDGAEHKCAFVAVNVLKQRIWLSLNNVTFRIEYVDKKDYEYAKRGETMRGTACKGGTKKHVKFVYK